MVASNNKIPDRSTSYRSVSYQLFLLMPDGSSLCARSKLDRNTGLGGLEGRDLLSKAAENSMPHSCSCWRDKVSEMPGHASHLT